MAGIGATRCFPASIWRPKSIKATPGIDIPLAPACAEPWPHPAFGFNASCSSWAHGPSPARWSTAGGQHQCTARHPHRPRAVELRQDGSTARWVNSAITGHWGQGRHRAETRRRPCALESDPYTEAGGFDPVSAARATRAEWTTRAGSAPRRSTLLGSGRPCARHVGLWRVNGGQCHAKQSVRSRSAPMGKPVAEVQGIRESVIGADAGAGISST